MPKEMIKEPASKNLKIPENKISQKDINYPFNPNYLNENNQKDYTYQVIENELKHKSNKYSDNINER